MFKPRLLIGLAFLASLAGAPALHAQDGQGDAAKRKLEQIQADKKKDAERRKADKKKEQEQAQRERNQRERDKEKTAAAKDDKQSGDGAGSADLARRTRDACRDEARDRDWRVVSAGTVQTSGRNGNLLMRLERRDEQRRADCRYDGERRSASLSIRDGDGTRPAGGSGGGSADAKDVREKCITEGYRQFPESRFQDAGKVQTGSRSEMEMTFDDRGGMPLKLRCEYDQRSRSVRLVRKT